jgi:hypothetical protein
VEEGRGQGDDGVVELPKKKKDMSRTSYLSFASSLLLLLLLLLLLHSSSLRISVASKVCCVCVFSFFRLSQKNAQFWLFGKNVLGFGAENVLVF